MLHRGTFSRTIKYLQIDLDWHRAPGTLEPQPQEMRLVDNGMCLHQLPTKDSFSFGMDGGHFAPGQCGYTAATVAQSYRPVSGQPYTGSCLNFVCNDKAFGG